MALTRDAIFKQTALPIKAVEVPEWEGTVYVRTLTGTERDQFEEGTRRFGRTGKPEPFLANLRARFVALCACDEKGDRLFSDDDAAELGRRSAVALDRVFMEAQRLNGMAPASAEEARGNS